MPFPLPFLLHCKKTVKQVVRENGRRICNHNNSNNNENNNNNNNNKNKYNTNLVTQMDVLGLLRIRVRKGINLAIRDTISSDPYCVLSCDTQRVKTRVVRGNCNPVWNEELTIYIKDINMPINMSVYDKDTFTVDDNMGNAKIDIKPLIECLRMGLQGLPEGTKVDRVQPTRENCLADESCVIWTKGKMVQDMVLRLNNVECGEVELQIEWVNIPGGKGF